MDINKAMQICFKNKIKIYPNYYKLYKSFRIVVNYNGKEKPIKKDVKPSEINNAIIKTYKFYAKKC